ncbi:DUF1259 domain-containing protein [Sporolactobacillus pectinivorans]|uniref:DUF1259 domain-containing protein n=1 Tax=Sporolactobacillus pectinivorans TaxID=1591408 RepID=UPI000C260D22|nr:DUF1259 domain-containing protein [Sporolactobacillus pectinivorans]
MAEMENTCQQFADILHGKSKFENGVCSITLRRTFNVIIQGKTSVDVADVEVLFESLDSSGNALNLAEIAVLQEEVPPFVWSVSQQGIIVSALHNHWIFTQPTILYIHLQSVEPPLIFAKKLANSFLYLNSKPVS